MELFSWIVIGALVGFLAKTTFAAERDENLFLLLGVGVVAAVGTGFLMESVFKTGFLSMSGASHVGSFLAAAIVLLAMRIVTTPRIPATSRPTTRRR